MTTASAAVVGTFKDKPVITLTREGSEREFSFGVNKAKLIVTHFDAIRAFAETVVEAAKPAKGKK